MEVNENGILCLKYIINRRKKSNQYFTNGKGPDHLRYTILSLETDVFL